ncbi:hypothetical protein LGH74_15520 [Hymenobacter sp. BT178]|uniref:Uncharacterized protein n=2 Tax=Hymenobacter lucidus TaxID=2880930 RepID=A0ABS8AT58_9BACT|nr:hypothetical protein [Hymenobacter lucidus]
MRDNKPNGLSYEFYPENQPDFIDSLVDGKRQGRYLEFFKRPAYRIHIRGKYALVDGQEKLVDFVEYDTTGRIVSASGH